MNAQTITGVKFCQDKGNNVLDIKGFLVALVISGVAGLSGSFFALTMSSARTEVQISGINSNIQKLDEKIDGVSDQVKKIRDDFYEPKLSNNRGH